MKKHDQPDRELSAMEFFILALVEKGGARSVYDLQKKALLQPGGIRPALDRLEFDGLLSRNPMGPRMKRDLALTDLGRKFLNEKWLFSLQSYLDLESTLRAVAVALLMGSVKTARDYLRDASTNRGRLASEQEHEAEVHAHRTDPLSIYMWMRSVCEARRRWAEAEALTSFRTQLKEEGHVHQQ